MASFSKGIMGVAPNEPVPLETMRLLERFAHVFDGTYIRFLDLQKAEAQALKAQNDLIEIKVARKKAEHALLELQAVQPQLIQSEKMASLGAYCRDSA
jgi:phosphoglycerate-specific signal transduction histidine kinase